MVSTNPTFIACVARNGGIVIAEACPAGLVPLAKAGNRRMLERAICRASGRVRGNQVILPGLHEGISDELANVVVDEFREALMEQFAEAKTRNDWCGRIAA